MKLTSLLGGSFIASSVGFFYAQAELAGALGGGTGILSVVIQGGSFALIAYLIIFALPAMQKDLREERKQERMDFAAALKLVTDSCREEVMGARGEVERIRVIFQQEQRELRNTFALEMEAMRKMYVDSLGAFRTAVHEVKDVAGITMNRANAAIMKVDLNKPGGGS